MKKHIHKLVFLLFLLSGQIFAKNNSNNILYSKSKIDLELTSCNLDIDKNEIIQKEFLKTKFQLDLNKNLLYVNEEIKENSKIIEFSLNNSKMIFKDQEEYGKLEAYLTIVNNLPVLKFKDHDDDCFFFLVNFSK